jgi:Rab proteins geranylgeranyltransferase component A
MHTTTPSFSAGSSVSPRYSIELADFPETLTCNVLISSARLVRPNLVQDVKQLSSDSMLNNLTSMARCIAIVDHPICFPPSTLSDTSTDYSQSGTSEGEAEPSPSSLQRPEITLPVSFPLDTGLLVFPPSSVPGGSTTMAATVLVTGEGSMSTPAGKCMSSPRSL